MTESEQATGSCKVRKYPGGGTELTGADPNDAFFVFAATPSHHPSLDAEYLFYGRKASQVGPCSGHGLSGSWQLQLIIINCETLCHSNERSLN